MPSEREIISQAVELIDREFYGVLCTVDEQGAPRARYMGAGTFGRGVERVYTLSTTHARKVSQIEHSPAVCWVFSDRETGDVVTLLGEAKIVAAPSRTGQVWDRLLRAAKHYSMEMLSRQEEVEYRAIETTVHTLEYLSPSRGIVSPRIIHLAGSAAGREQEGGG
ncbi:MAG: pyridoxamine 5'-phosphate oxidase family protein [Phycisphaeraceae bacterium]